MEDLAADFPTVSNSRLFGGVDRYVNASSIVMPGQQISQTGDFMRGHGTYTKSKALFASVTGTVRQVNKLLNVQCVRQQYNPEVGDVVVGAITEVQDKRWKVNIDGRTDANLLLASVNLPGGELRRKTTEDELAMREYLVEGDFISAEVQQVYNDGSAFLHTRSLKYGKLGLGLAVKVPSYLIKRRKAHFHSLPCGAGMIIGLNGMIWLCEQLHDDVDGGYNIDLQARIPEESLKVIMRLRNCINVLSKYGISVFETSIMNAYDISMQYETKDMLRSEVAAELAAQVIQQLRASVDD